MIGTAFLDVAAHPEAQAVEIISELGRICNSARRRLVSVHQHIQFLRPIRQPAPFLSLWSSANDRTSKAPTPFIPRRGPHWIQTECLVMLTVSAIQTSLRMAMTSRYGVTLATRRMHDAK